MQIRVGYELTHDLPEETPMLLTPHVHPARASDLVVPDHLTTDPSVAVAAIVTRFGDWISRILTPAGRIRLFPDATVRDSSEPGLGSRYCETDRLSDLPGLRRMAEKNARTKRAAPSRPARKFAGSSANRPAGSASGRSPAPSRSARTRSPP